MLSGDYIVPDPRRRRYGKTTLTAKAVLRATISLELFEMSLAEPVRVLRIGYYLMSAPNMTAPNPTDQASLASYWNQLLAPYMQLSSSRALFQLSTTALLFAAGWLAMFWSLEISYGLTLLLAIPTAGLLIRLFIFQHDCGHGSFFKNRRLNNTVGFLIGILMLTPYQYWRRTHAIHHASSGDLDRRGFGDISTLTVAEYLALSRARRFGYRLYRSMPVLLFVGPIYQFFLKHRFPLDAPRAWKQEWSSVLWTNLVLLTAVVAASLAIGWQRLILVHLPILLLAQALGVWLFYVQHQFEDTYWRRHPEWNYHRAGLEGSSFYDLPSVLHWFTGNIGFHHIHHLSSKIPNYSLKRCFRETPEVHGITRLTLFGSLRCSRLKLWDEEGGRLVGFHHLGAPSKAASS